MIRNRARLDYVDGLKREACGAIIAEIDRRGLSNNAAARLTGIGAPDVSRLRAGDLNRFTLDRLVQLLHALGRRAQLVILP